jgi:hypothetical protein
MARLRYYGVPWTFVEPTAICPTKVQIESYASDLPESCFHVSASVSFTPEEHAIIQHSSGLKQKSNVNNHRSLSRMDFAKCQHRERSQRALIVSKAVSAVKIPQMSSAEEMDQEPFLSSRNAATTPRYDFDRVSGDHLGQTRKGGDGDGAEKVTDGQVREVVRIAMNARAKKKEPGEGLRVLTYHETVTKQYTQYKRPARLMDGRGQKERQEDDEPTYIGQRFRAFLLARDKAASVRRDTFVSV